jgi:hypothetical protein
LLPVTNTGLLTCQSAGFVDNSGNNFVVTRNGDTSVQRFNPFGTTIQSPLSYGGFFDGTGDYMTVPYSSNFDLSTGDWTMEAWFNVNSFTGQIIIAKDTSGVNFDWSLGITNSTINTLNAFGAGSSSGQSSGGNYYYAGGGGGSVDQFGGPRNGGAGGLGGGAAGSSAKGVAGAAGTANTGGGGGGGGNDGVADGGAGGSGLVVIRTIGSYTATGTTGSPTRNENDGYTYYKFTGDGSITI